MIEQAILWINTIAEKQGEGIVIWGAVITVFVAILVVDRATRKD